MCIVVPFCGTLHSQPQTRPDLAERLRQRSLSANEKALEQFCSRNLPVGWSCSLETRLLTLRRQAPVYVLDLPPREARRMAKAELLHLARKNGRKTDCTIAFTVERHDDIALMRQKVRLFKEIRTGITQAYDRLRLKHLCRGMTPAECSLSAGAPRDAAAEFLATRQILADKLEITPLYRIGTLYLYPLRNQCVPPAADWYVTNTQIRETDFLLPFEAAEEVEMILRNWEQVKFWD